MFLTLFTVFYVLFGSSCGLQEKEMCIGGSVRIDMYRYISYSGPLYFYPREGGVMKTLMNKRQPMDERLLIYTESVKLTKLTEKDNGKFAIVNDDGVVSDILSLTVNDCPEKILLFTGQELVRNVPSNAYYLHVTYSQSPDHSQLLWDHRNGDYGRRGRVSGNVFRISEVTHEDVGKYNFRDRETSMVLQIQLDVRESHPIITYIIVAVVAVLLVPICYCCCCKKCCCKNKKPPSEVAQTAAEPKVFYHDLTQLEGSGFSAAPHPAAFPPPAGSPAFPPPTGSAAFPPPTGSAGFPPPTGSAGFPPPTGSAAFPPPTGSAAFPPPTGSPAFPPPTGSAAFPPPAGSAAFPPPAGSAAFPPPAGSAAFPPSAGNVHFPPPAGSAAFRPPAGIPAFPPPEGNAGIPYDAAASSTGPVPYQPTYEIKNIFQPKVAPGASEKSASFNYNPLSSDYQPMFEVKGKSYNFDLPLSTENSSAEVYKSDKMNFL